MHANLKKYLSILALLMGQGLSAEMPIRKRQSESVDNESCMIFCYLDLNEALDNVGFTLEDLEEPWKIRNFPSMCSVVREGLQCMDRCRPSAFKLQMTPVAESYRFMCVDRYEEFSRFVRCIRRIRPIADATCDPKCGGSLKPLQKELRSMLQTLIPSQRRLHRVSEIFCRNAECNLSCSQPILQRRCRRAAPITKEFLFKAFNAFEAAMKDKLPNGWPKTCDSMMTFFQPSTQ